MLINMIIKLELLIHTHRGSINFTPIKYDDDDDDVNAIINRKKIKLQILIANTCYICMYNIFLYYANHHSK